MSDYLDYFGDKNIEGTHFEDPFLVAVLWILRIPKFSEPCKNIRGNGHFNKGFRAQPTNSIKDRNVIRHQKDMKKVHILVHRGA